jgi:signal transduction histidine kinase
VHFDGPVDSAIAPELYEHILAVLRELLSNAARHARATSVDIHLRAGVDISLGVIDNGAGPGATREAGHGLTNLRERASALGGEFTVKPADRGGTAATWTVPRATPVRA